MLKCIRIQIAWIESAFFCSLSIGINAIRKAIRLFVRALVLFIPHMRMHVRDFHNIYIEAILFIHMIVGFCGQIIWLLDYRIYFIYNSTTDTSSRARRVCMQQQSAYGLSDLTNKWREDERRGGGGVRESSKVINYGIKWYSTIADKHKTNTYILS